MGGSASFDGPLELAEAVDGEFDGDPVVGRLDVEVGGVIPLRCPGPQVRGPVGVDPGPGGVPGQLLISADGGGSNGYRLRAWKTELGALATETGLAITVCHLPPGTSKWNKIEHRLFSHISMNWRGRPLTSHQVIVDLIAATTTRTGLTVHAELETSAYPTGIKSTDQQMAALPITHHDFHGEWNYTIQPGPSP